MERKVSDGLEMPSITLPMGPFLLNDECGMKAAIALLDRSLDPGRYADHVQFGTFQKVKSTITNIIQAGVDGLEETLVWELTNESKSGQQQHPLRNSGLLDLWKTSTKGSEKLGCQI
jgi:hypothetical protein